MVHVGCLATGIGNGKAFQIFLKNRTCGWIGMEQVGGSGSFVSAHGDQELQKKKKKKNVYLLEVKYEKCKSLGSGTHKGVCIGKYDEGRLSRMCDKEKKSRREGRERKSSRKNQNDDDGKADMNVREIVCKERVLMNALVRQASFVCNFNALTAGCIVG